MGYLTDTRTAEVYRYVTRIAIDPATSNLSITIAEGIDIEQPDGAVRFVSTAADVSPDLSGSGTMLTAPLAALLPALGVGDLAALGALSIKDLVVRLVDAALTPQVPE